MTCSFISAGFPNFVLKPISCSVSVVARGTTADDATQSRKSTPSCGQRESRCSTWRNALSGSLGRRRDFTFWARWQGENCEGWKGRLKLRAAHGQGLSSPGSDTPGSIPEVHRQWKSSTLAILAGWVSPSSLGYSQKPTCDLWGVFTNRLCLKPLNLWIPRDEDTAFTWQAHCKGLIPVRLTLNLVYFKPVY